jgi:hypothetical protein
MTRAYILPGKKYYFSTVINNVTGMQGFLAPKLYRVIQRPMFTSKKGDGNEK